MKRTHETLQPLALAAVLLLAGCGQAEDTGPQAAASEPAAETDAVASPVQLTVPAARYSLDPNHAQVAISVQHMGLSNYVIRFTGYEATLDLADPASASSISLTIDPTSVDPVYTSDYTATHPDSAFSSWAEDLAQSEKFLNASAYPGISFASTAVTLEPGGAIAIDGELTLLGVTRPVGLTATVTGQVASHPFTKQPAIAFSASGRFNRSDFGMTHLLEPALVSDEVTLRFEGEFLLAEESPVTD